MPAIQLPGRSDPSRHDAGGPRRLSFRPTPRPTGPWLLLGPAAVALAIVVVMFVMVSRILNQVSHVVVYTSQDQVYAEPIFKAFEERTRIRVQPVFDSEAVKTVGLANRLVAERNRPQCDVFWNNEELRTRQLMALGVLNSQQPPLELGYRSRRLVIHTNHLTLAEAPQSLLELTNARWRGRVALAYPLFGTTATHFHVLRQRWGETAWLDWCRALQANQPLVVDGNSVVVRLVGRGEAWVGLTDSDDIAAGQREGYPIAALPLTAESLLIPNTAAAVAGAPRPLMARQFLDYLARPETQEQLRQAGALEGIDRAGLPVVPLPPDWPALLRDLDAANNQLKSVILR